MLTASDLLGATFYFLIYLTWLFFMESNSRSIIPECPVWKNFRNGDPQALATIFNDHYDSLYYYGRRLVRDEDLVKDCVQNLFLKMWTSRERLRPIEYVRFYLMKSLRRHIGDQVIMQKRNKSREHLLQYEFEITFSHEDFLIASQISREQSDALANSLNNLSARQREAVFLKFYEECEYSRIADIMNLNVQSVRNLIYQSLKCIKNQMAPFGQPVFMNVRSGIA
jgi:RNA polymerase sigma factor (sigma-70 family)